MITVEAFKMVVPVKEDRAEELVKAINTAAPAYWLDKNVKVMQMFIAQTAHESGAFSIKSENMNYSITRMRQIWPSRFPTVGSAEPYAMNPKALANKVYNGRMGNKVGTDDGFNFRGGGYLQTTGFEAYKAYQQYKKTQLPLEQLAEKIRTEEVWALDVAMWEFCIFKNLEALSEEGDIVAVTKRINGGLIGLEERKKYYKRAQLYLN